MKVTLHTLLLTSALIAAPALAFENDGAQNKQIAEHFAAHVPDGGCFANKREDFFKSLNFTDAQLEKMASLKDTYMTSTAAKKAELKSLRRQMHNLLLGSTIDRQQLTSLQDKANALRTDLSNQRLAFAMDRSEVLTAEQRNTIHRKMLEMSMMPHHGHGHHHMHG